VRLVLASASPRRASLLTAAGFSFETIAVDADERARPSEAPAEYVVRLAAEKAAAGFEALRRRARRLPSGATETDDVQTPSPIVVIGADTAVVVDREILGKPVDDAHARHMLGRLSGQAHQVMTGVCGRTEGKEVTLVDVTTVWFAPLTNEEIDWYIASGEWRDKAGAYAIQGLAARFIPRIDGSYSNVVGLPIAAVYTLVGRIGR
jgi:septum formation protein